MPVAQAARLAARLMPDDEIEAVEEETKKVEGIDLDLDSDDADDEAEKSELEQPEKEQQKPAEPSQETAQATAAGL